MTVSVKQRDIPKALTERARELRHEAPVPERILWGLLRDRRLFGLKFRRQHPAPPCVLDFYCDEHHTAIELDGESHTRQGQYDVARDAFLNQQGIRVLRITNDDLLGDPIWVAEYIAEQMVPGITKKKQAPSPQPSPRGRGSQSGPSPLPSPGGRGGKNGPSTQSSLAKRG